MESILFNLVIDDTIKRYMLVDLDIIYLDSLLDAYFMQMICFCYVGQ